MKNIILGIKGFVFGIANIIPGVSGGTLAITLGIYEDLIKAISHFFTNFKKNIKFLLPIIIGAGLAILLMSKVIDWCLSKHPFPTTLFFIALILGGVPLISRKVKKEKVTVSNIIVFLITFGLIMAMTFMKTDTKAVTLDTLTLGSGCLLFLVGMVAAGTMIIPGVSGSFVLMLLGYYKPIINTISHLTDNFTHSLLILIPFGIGILIGIVLIAKLIEMLLNKYKIKTYYGILGFVLASIIALIVPLFGLSPSLYEVLVALVLVFLGLTIGYKLGDK